MKLTDCWSLELRLPHSEHRFRIICFYLLYLIKYITHQSQTKSLVQLLGLLVQKGNCTSYMAKLSLKMYILLKYRKKFQMYCQNVYNFSLFLIFFFKDSMWKYTENLRLSKISATWKLRVTWIGLSDGLVICSRT